MKRVNLTWNYIEDQRPDREGVYFIIIPVSERKYYNKLFCSIEVAEWIKRGSVMLSCNGTICKKTGFYEVSVDDQGFIYSYIESPLLSWAEIPNIPEKYIHPYQEFQKKASKPKQDIYNLYNILLKTYENKDEYEFYGLKVKPSPETIQIGSICVESLLDIVKKLQKTKEEGDINETLTKYIKKTEGLTDIIDINTRLSLFLLITLTMQTHKIYQYKKYKGVVKASELYRNLPDALQEVIAKHYMFSVLSLKRLLKLDEIKAPKIIIDNEKRLLFEALAPLFMKIEGPGTAFHSTYGVLWDDCKVKEDDVPDTNRGIKRSVI